jgi:hypothetical protein
VEMITMSIIDRNIEDDNWVLPITFENVQKLSMIDIATLMTMVVGEKKK